MPEAIRVLIAEDSPTVRLYLRMILQEASGFIVVGEARDGSEAILMTQQLRPDVITMDINMPHVDGLSATRQIMAQCPTPVVVVSGVIGTEVDQSMRALEAGALAVLPKLPDQTRPDYAVRRQQLVQTLRAMAGVKVISRRDYGTAAPFMNVVARTIPTRPKPEIVVIGSSTGGPSALQRTFAVMPADYPYPVVVVQHMPDEFLSGLTRWIADSTPLNVQMAHHGIELRGGTIYIAPGGAHLTIQRRHNHLMTALVDEQGEHRFKPSINVLFNSVADACGAAAAAVILTGMGDDGTEGMARMKQTGAYTYAQDAASCVVFGMPAAAIERGVVEKVVSLGNLPAELLKLL